MVVGGTGAGKTTLLNSLVNYCLGVHAYDRFRYRIVDDAFVNTSKSVTKNVTEYFVEGTERNPPLIIIDTPGFGDNEGVD